MFHNIGVYRSKSARKEEATQKHAQKCDPLILGPHPTHIEKTYTGENRAAKDNHARRRKIHSIIYGVETH